MDKHAFWQLASTGHQRSSWVSGRDLDFISCLRSADTGTTVVSEWLATFLAIGSRISPAQLSVRPKFVPEWLLSQNSSPADHPIQEATSQSHQQQQPQHQGSIVSSQHSDSFSTISHASSPLTTLSGAFSYPQAAVDNNNPGIGHPTVPFPLYSSLQEWSSTSMSGLLQQQQQQQQLPQRNPLLQQDPAALLGSNTAGVIPAWKSDAMVDTGSLLSPDLLHTRRVFSSTTASAAGLTSRVNNVYSLQEVHVLVTSHPALTTAHLAKLTYKAAELLNSQSHPGMSNAFAKSLVLSMMQDILQRLELKISRLMAQDLRLILHGWSQANFMANPQMLSAIISGLLPGQGSRIGAASSDDLLVIIRSLHKLQAAPLNLLHATAVLMARRAPNENFTKVAEFAHLLANVSPNSASLSAAARSFSGGNNSKWIEEGIPVRLIIRDSNRKPLRSSGSGSSHSVYQELTGPQRNGSISTYTSNTSSSGSSHPVNASLAGTEAMRIDQESTSDNFQPASSQQDHWLQSTPGLTDIAQTLVNAALPKIFSTANTQDIIKLVSALSSVGFYSFQLCDASAAALLPQIHTATLRQVATLSHAFALCGHSHAMLFESLALHATPQLAASVAEVEAERKQGMMGLTKLSQTATTTTATSPAISSNKEAAVDEQAAAGTAVAVEVAVVEARSWTSWNPWGVVSRAVIGSASEADKAATRASHRAATIRDITQIAAAFTSLGYFHPPMFDAVAASAAQRLELQGKVRVFPSDLCKLAATYTGAGHYDGRLYRALGTRMAAMSGSLTLPELIHLVTCFALAHHYDIESVRLLVDRATAELQAAAAIIMPQQASALLNPWGHQTSLQKAVQAGTSMLQRQRQLSHVRMPFQEQQNSDLSSGGYLPHTYKEQYLPPPPLSTFWLPGVLSLSTDNRPANPAEYDSMLQPLTVSPPSSLSPYNHLNHQQQQQQRQGLSEVENTEVDPTRLPLAMQSATRTLAICATFAHPCPELLQLLSDVSVVIKDASLSQEAQPSWTVVAPPSVVETKRMDRKSSRSAISAAAAAVVVPLYMVESEELSLLTVSELCRLVGDLALLEGLPSQQGGGGRPGRDHSAHQFLPTGSGDSAGSYGTQLQQSALGTLSARLYPEISISRPSVGALISSVRQEGGTRLRQHTSTRTTSTPQQQHQPRHLNHHRNDSHSQEQEEEDSWGQEQRLSSSYARGADSGRNLVPSKGEVSSRLTGADKLCLYSAYVRAAGRQQGESFLASLGPGGGALIRDSASAWRSSPMFHPPSADMAIASVEDALRQRGRRVRLNSMTDDNLLHVPLMVEDSRGGWVVIDVGDGEQGLTRGGEAVRTGVARHLDTPSRATDLSSSASQQTREENRASSVLWRRGTPSSAQSSEQTGPDLEALEDEQVKSSRRRLAAMGSGSKRAGSAQEEQQVRQQPSMQLGDGAFRTGCLLDRGMPRVWIPFQQWREVEAARGLEGVGAWVEALLLQCEGQRTHNVSQQSNVGGGGSGKQPVQGRLTSRDSEGQDGRGQRR